MNSQTHRLVAIPKRVRLYRLSDFAEQEECRLDIDHATGLLILSDGALPRRPVDHAPSFAVTEPQ